YKDKSGDQSSGVIEDAAGNDLATFKAIPVNNITADDKGDKGEDRGDDDTTPPTVTAAVIDGDTLTISLNERLADTVPKTRNFTIKNGRKRIKVDTASINTSDNTVSLDLKSAVAAGEDSVTLAYKDKRGDQSSGVIEDAVGNDLGTFKAIPVNNIISADDTLVISGQRDILIDGSGPESFRRSNKGKDTITDVSSSDSNPIEASESLALQLFQPGDDLLLKANTINTTLLNTSSDNLIGHQSDLF
ncbi:MAG: SwmB domain-containing protein, partial [Prochlorococcus sp.]